MILIALTSNRFRKALIPTSLETFARPQGSMNSRKRLIGSAIASRKFEACRASRFLTIDPSRSGISIRPWQEGYRAAEKLRMNLGLERHDPNLAIKHLFDGKLEGNDLLLREGPPSLDALLRRNNGNVQTGVLKLHPSQRRFHACRAVYLAWCCSEREQAAATVAATRKQQASRAFAAEFSHPRNCLRSAPGDMA